LIKYSVLKNWDFGEIRHTYTERDTMLYALGVGLGSNPVDPKELQYTYEAHLRVLPTMATVIGSPGFWLENPRTGADAIRLVHGEQYLRIHRPLPTHGTVVARNRVESLTDKGVGKGALAVVTRDLVDAESGDLLSRGTHVSFLRGDGGFSAEDGLSDPSPRPLPGTPQRPADVEVVLETVPQAALIYRLSGDYNPLHADLTIATKAGFSRPILHGLCTYGLACHAVLRACVDYEPDGIRSLAVRFTSPVYPGEAVRFELWQENQHHWRLRATVDARGCVVLNNGEVEIH
jgi:acyl dehydratase